MRVAWGSWSLARPTSVWTLRRVRALTLAGMVVSAITAGGACRRHAEKVSDPPNPSPTTMSAATTAPSAAMAQSPNVRGVDTSTRSFTNAAGGVHLTYPSGWQPTPSDDFILMLRPADERASG